MQIIIQYTKFTFTIQVFNYMIWNLEINLLHLQTKCYYKKSPMNEDNISIRLKFLIEKLGINSSQFADSCKIPRPTFSQILNGRNKKISDQIIRQIHEAYPNVSITWLLFNEGDMFNGAPAYSNNLEVGGESLIGQPSPESGGEESNFPFENQISSEMRFENEKIPANKSRELENKNYRCLKTDKNEDNNIVDEEVKSILNSPEILSKIAQMSQKTRKVVSVTIYYDDSTFETFKPA